MLLTAGYIPFRRAPKVRIRRLGRVGVDLGLMLLALVCVGWLRNASGLLTRMFPTTPSGPRSTNISAGWGARPRPSRRAGNS